MWVLLTPANSNIRIRRDNFAEFGLLGTKLGDFRPEISVSFYCQNEKDQTKQVRVFNQNVIDYFHFKIHYVLSFGDTLFIIHIYIYIYIYICILYVYSIYIYIYIVRSYIIYICTCTQLCIHPIYFISIWPLALYGPWE